jgi:hypothetical protein
MFEKILLLEWPAQTIALSFERRLLERIAMAYRAIQCFMLSAGEASDRNLLHLQSPAFAHNSTNMLHGISLMITSPRKEDASWAGDLIDQVQAALDLASNERTTPMATHSSAQHSAPTARVQNPQPILTSTPSGVQIASAASIGIDASAHSCDRRLLISTRQEHIR